MNGGDGMRLVGYLLGLSVQLRLEGKERSWGAKCHHSSIASSWWGNGVSKCWILVECCTTMIKSSMVWVLMMTSDGLGVYSRRSQKCESTESRDTPASNDVDNVDTSNV